ncbi:MAG: SDR family oxidoreductase [Burkholderiales bacterium]|nr:SDR family oxidoreductase [Burkholderiales bacterium]
MPKHVVVTGAGSGIGRAIAEHLAESNHNILLLGRNSQSLDETRERLRQPAEHKSFACDVRKPEQIRAALEESGIQSLYGVVANAGVGSENHYGDADCWQDIIDTNLTGSYSTIQECLPYLKNDPLPYRKILVMSSILARVGAPGYAAYCASKAGQLGLTRALAAELAGDKILVNALCPSWVDTQMAHSFYEEMARAMGVTKNEAYQVAMSQVPLGKMVMPEEVARLVGFLMSEEETSITGQAFDINNGVLMV